MTIEKRERLLTKVTDFYKENPNLSTDLMVAFIEKDTDKVLEIIRWTLRNFSIVEWCDISELLDEDELYNLMMEDEEIETYVNAIDDERDRRLEAKNEKEES